MFSRKAAVEHAAPNLKGAFAVCHLTQLHQLNQSFPTQRDETQTQHNLFVPTRVTELEWDIPIAGWDSPFDNLKYGICKARATTVNHSTHMPSPTPCFSK